MESTTDPHDLQRFLSAQLQVIDQVGVGSGYGFMPISA